MDELKKIEIDDDFLAEVRARENEKHYKVYLSKEIIESDYCGPLYGYYIDNTYSWNVLATTKDKDKFDNIVLVGNISDQESTGGTSSLLVVIRDKKTNEEK